MDLEELRRKKRARDLSNSLRGSARSNVLNRGGDYTSTAEEAERHYHLAKCYEKGLEGYSVDEGREYEEYLKAAELGHPMAMVEVAADMAQNENNRLGYDLERAQDFAQKAVSLGEANGYVALALIQHEKQHGSDALELLKQGIIHNSIYCIQVLSAHLLSDLPIGDLEINDYVDEAVQVLENANWGEATVIACRALGGVYYYTKEDHKRAIRYYNQALEYDPMAYVAMAELGIIYRNSKELLDYKKAQELLLKAAENGQSDGMNQYGIMLALGEGMNQNEAAAMEWFKKSADFGNADAMLNIGDLLSEDDPEQAKRWYKQAEDAGSETAKERLQELANSSTGNREESDKISSSSNRSNNIMGRVFEIVQKTLMVDWNEIHSYSEISKDLGADSLDAVELIMEMEKEFGLAIPDAEAERIRTVGDIIDYIESHI